MKEKIQANGTTVVLTVGENMIFYFIIIFLRLSG